MAKPLSILYVSSEVFPFAKVGGVGDIAYSLPLAIRDAGHDIRVMLPKYGIVSERRNKIHEINRLRDMPIPAGSSMELATVKSSSIFNPRTKVQAYISTNIKFFDLKKGIYGDPKTGIDYEDNDERFLFFSRTVIETCLILGWFPDVIHCNDWQTAAVMALAKTLFPNKFKKTRFLFTVHNFAQQGEFPEESFEKYGLPATAKDNFMHKGKINFLKAGLKYADYVNTVSNTYATDVLQDSKHTNGLNEELITLGAKFTGIINGIDIWGWNPKTDVHISKQYVDEIDEFKAENKKAICESFGLPYKPETPLIGVIGKFSEAKGTDLLLKTLPKLLEGADVQVAILGDGENSIKDEMKNIYKNHFEKFAFKLGFDEDVAHSLEAASDMFLIPSLYEPCGLNSMYSMLYGAAPIARATGGLSEIVKEYDSETKSGNGFVFNDYNSDEMLAAINRALDLFKRKDEWNDFAKRIMKSDFTWDESVKKYVQIYYGMFKD
jgi:starch synthase